jgi:hypothetical protein
MAELIAQLAAARSETNIGVLAARAALGRALLDAGQVERARTEMASAVQRYRTQLVEGHSLAAALELDLVRLELMQGRPQQAAERLEAQRDTILGNFPESSRYRRKLDCLAAGDTDAACWR